MYEEEECIIYFRQLLFKSDKQKLSLEELSEKIGGHPGRDLL